MQRVCNACNNIMQTLDYLECRACSGVYDIQCLNIVAEEFNALTESFKGNWLCPTCVSALPKGDNSSTPIRSMNSGLNNTYTASRIDNINHIRGVRRNMDAATPIAPITISSHEVAALMDQIHILREELREYKDSFNSKFQKMDTIIKEQAVEITSLKNTVSQLQFQIQEQDQRLVSDELEMIGVPEREGESLLHMTLLTAKKLGVELTERDINHVSRV